MFGNFLFHMNNIIGQYQHMLPFVSTWVTIRDLGIARVVLLVGCLQDKSYISIRCNQ